MLRCERIDTALRDRVWTIPFRSGERRWNGLYLQGGAARIEDNENQSWLDPSMVFLGPVDAAQSIRMLAGSEGCLFAFDLKQATSTIGHGADGEDLFQLLENRVLVRLGQGGMATDEVEFALALLMREGSHDAPGRASLLDAALKLLLVAILRNLPQAIAPRHRSDRSSHLLHRFRHLLEARFRDRWTVAHYARALEIGPDRLHDLCTGKLGKTPSELIGERCDFEARILLRNLAVPVTEVSDRLGFKDPSHFSRVFKKMNGESPRAFRNRTSQTSDAGQDGQISYADWP